MPVLRSVAANAAIGPVYNPKAGKKGRNFYLAEETCSRTDSVFQDKAGYQKLNHQDYVYPNPCAVEENLDYRLLIREYSSMINEHIQRRVLFGFQQLIMCYQTKLHFVSVGAKDQGLSASRIVLNVEDEESVPITRNGAHDCGNPCLIAYDSDEWELYEGDEAEIPQGFVFLKDTDYYKTVNAVMNMPYVNEADREIDEKTKNSHLREKGDVIINRVSQGEITPDQGILELVRDILSEVKAARRRLGDRRKDLEVREVLSYYERYLVNIQRNIESNPTFLENFLNIKIGGDLQNEDAKRIILQMRYAAIRDAQVDQSALIQKIEAVKEQIFNDPAILDNSGRMPIHYVAAFNTLFIEKARTDEDRHRLIKLLNFSPFNFIAQLPKNITTRYSKTKETLSAYNPQIEHLAREILNDMRHLRSKEMSQRAQTVKELRLMRGWSQRRLGEEVKQVYPQAAASQSTICRIENEKKLVTSQIAEELSDILDVDAGLFMPHFFYD